MLKQPLDSHPHQPPSRLQLQASREKVQNLKKVFEKSIRSSAAVVMMPTTTTTTPSISMEEGDDCGVYSYPMNIMEEKTIHQLHQFDSSFPLQTTTTTTAMPSLAMFPGWTGLSPMQVERQRAIHELVESEKVFVTDMRQLLNEQRLKILKSKVLADEEAARLEACLNPLWSVLTLNERMLEVMLAKHRHSQNDIINVIAIDLIPIFEEFKKPYSCYSAICQDVQQYFLYLQSKYRQQIDVKWSLTEDESRLVFENLAKPINRLIRYRMIFERLCESTAEGHVDYLSCLDLLEKCKNLLEYIDSIKDSLDRIKELKVFEKEMSFKYALSLDGKKKKAPKFTFQVYRDDGSRYVVLQDPFCQVIPKQSFLSGPEANPPGKIPFTFRQYLMLFMTNDLLFIGCEMSFLERKKEGKKWKMLHEPIPLSMANMELLPSGHYVKGSTSCPIEYHWCKLVLQPGECYYLSAPLKQIQSWANYINQVPSSLSCSDLSRPAGQQPGRLSRRGSLIKSVIQSLIPSRSSNASPTKSIDYESTRFVNEDFEFTSELEKKSIDNKCSEFDNPHLDNNCTDGEPSLESLDDGAKIVYRNSCKAYFWNASVQNPGWSTLNTCQFLICREKEATENDPIFTIRLCDELDKQKSLFVVTIGTDLEPKMEKEKKQIRRLHKRLSNKASKSDVGSEETGSTGEVVRLSLNMYKSKAEEVSNSESTVCVLLRVKSRERAEEFMENVQKIKLALFNNELNARLHSVTLEEITPNLAESSIEPEPTKEQIQIASMKTVEDLSVETSFIKRPNNSFMSDAGSSSFNVTEASCSSENILLPRQPDSKKKIMKELEEIMQSGPQTNCHYNKIFLKGKEDEQSNEPEKLPVNPIAKDIVKNEGFVKELTQVVSTSHIHEETLLIEESEDESILDDIDHPEYDEDLSESNENGVGYALMEDLDNDHDEFPKLAKRCSSIDNLLDPNEKRVNKERGYELIAQELEWLVSDVENQLDKLENENNEEDSLDEQSTIISAHHLKYTIDRWYQRQRDMAVVAAQIKESPFYYGIDFEHDYGGETDSESTADPWQLKAEYNMAMQWLNTLTKRSSLRVVRK